ncbi:uncharacterized protein LOC125469892 [Pyrus x bretschneideri]|uniref:uncharacterized protein LOC125469892 n=1 Tax=Pyrus x bretschneideri TaxID=225117 RepID=UPI00202E6C05|nr:uncharacterized protein LOC125469892 [Pyrus x bretschneideri]
MVGTWNLVVSHDFLAMKGCKLPQRPKKRAKLIQRSLLLVSPGAWLTDMCQERREVREKKSSKKALELELLYHLLHHFSLFSRGMSIRILIFG